VHFDTVTAVLQRQSSN